MSTPIQFKPKTRKQLEQYVTESFPDAECDTAGNVVTGVALGLHLRGDTRIDLGAHSAQLDKLAKDLRLDAKALDAETGEELPVLSVKASSPFRYYNVRATHDREEPDLRPFTGRIPMVRIRLPNKDNQAKDFKTDLGTVLKSDHFYRSVQEFTTRFKGRTPYESAVRLDLITPPRGNPFGLRFGAISAYLGYLNNDAIPDFYVLEAGTATGQPKVPFPAPSFDSEIWAFADYTPTPFASKRHIYRGKLEWRETGTKRLQIQVRKQAAAEPYMRLDVRFSETRKPWKIWPGFLILKAALIVGSRKAIGVT